MIKLSGRLRRQVTLPQSNVVIVLPTSSRDKVAPKEGGHKHEELSAPCYTTQRPVPPLPGGGCAPPALGRAGLAAGPWRHRRLALQAGTLHLQDPELVREADEQDRRLCREAWRTGTNPWSGPPPIPPAGQDA